MARGIGKFCNKDYIFTESFFKKVLQPKTTLNYKECRNVIDHSNKIVATVIQKEIDGFKLPFGMGYLCSVRYVPNKPMINWDETNKLGKYVYHTNMHTDGFACRVVWFRVGRSNNMHYHEVYKFKADGKLSKAVSTLFAQGKSYNDWTIDDFLQKGRLENLYNKKFRKDLNTI